MTGALVVCGTILLVLLNDDFSHGVNFNDQLLHPKTGFFILHDKHEIELHTGWTACHASTVIDPSYGCTPNNARLRRIRSHSRNHNSNATAAVDYLPSFVLLNVSTLPTTAMAVLIDNQQIPMVKGEYNDNNTIIRMNNIYHSQNIAKVPDIHVTGREYYTLLYQIKIPSSTTNLVGTTNDDYHSKVYINFAGINYRTTVWHNGKELPNLQYRHFHTTGIGTSTVRRQPPPQQRRTNITGMFVRHRYDITPPLVTASLQQIHTANPSRNCSVDNRRNNSTNLLVVMIEPPFHPGYSPVPNGGQGGSHDLAKDGAVPQYMLGWDWCTSMPDRATGFYGAVTLQSYQYKKQLHSSSMIDSSLFDDSHDNDVDNIADFYATIHDPTIQTVDLTDCMYNRNQVDQHSDYICNGITLRILVHIEWTNQSPRNRRSDWTASDAIHSNNNHYNNYNNTFTLSIASDWGEFWNISIRMCDYYSEKDDGFIDIQENITIINTDQVQLWWPHGIGISNFAHLHNFTMTIHINDAVATDSVTTAAGIRTVDTYLDHSLQGQRYRINHHDIYLIGGNWIGTDQALRFSASKQRYCDEVLLHQHAGFNLIRVWGGSTAEREEFYDCADQYGMLVYQEFWMTGDNNGRWAGNYSWPLDYDSYLVNVEDTIKRLRRHPSLLFYGGCNECLSSRESPWAPNPPRQIDDGTRMLIETFDPGRFYISSSMGGPNIEDSFSEPSMYHNRTFSLAYGDGPYGMLLPSAFFDRNPGQPSKDFSIGFQPEIGSASVPTMNGMLKFMSRQEIDIGYPRRNASTSVGDDWKFHNFLSWTTVLPTNESYDHVYAYYGRNHNVKAADWIVAAQLAAHMQYQYLCNGYISRIFNYTSGFILWKTQTPWPSLRGFLYDWYLESTGMMTGVRSALRSPTSVFFDPQSWQLTLVNRQIFPIACTPLTIGVQYTWIDIHGAAILSGVLHMHYDVPAMSARLLGFHHQRLRWPKLCTDVCFLRLEGIKGCDYFTKSWYWLTNPDKGGAGNYSLLGEMRSRRMDSFRWSVENCVVMNNTITLRLMLQRPHEARDVMFYPTFSLLRQSDGSQLLPLFDLNDTDLVILPGTTQLRIIQSPAILNAGENLLIKVSSWNVPDAVLSFTC